ncbi:hypothetical protein [Streptomyces sp. NPDC059564]|uniref:hypothetical protein n=1 Tax=Streptomyces sp. NPDC059564 TaxID=3346865 RepID=UPI0036D0C2F8
MVQCGRHAGPAGRAVVQSGRHGRTGNTREAGRRAQSHGRRDAVAADRVAGLQSGLDRRFGEGGAEQQPLRVEELAHERGMFSQVPISATSPAESARGEVVSVHPPPLVVHLVDAGGFQWLVRAVACEPADKRPAARAPEAVRVPPGRRAVGCLPTDLRVGDQVMAGGSLGDNACLSAAAHRRPVAVVAERLP